MLKLCVKKRTLITFSYLLVLIFGLIIGYNFFYQKNEMVPVVKNPQKEIAPSNAMMNPFMSSPNNKIKNLNVAQEESFDGEEEKFNEKDSNAMQEVSYVSPFDGKVLKFSNLGRNPNLAMGVEDISYDNEVCPQKESAKIDTSSDDLDIKNDTIDTSGCVEKLQTITVGSWLVKNGAYCSTKQVFIIDWVSQTSITGKTYIVPRYLIYNTASQLCQELDAQSHQAYSPDEAVGDSTIMEGDIVEQDPIQQEENN